MGRAEIRTYIRFAHYEADLTTGKLFRDGEDIRLQQKPFQILELLLLSAGELVTRERIAETVWPGIHVEIAGCLNTAIRKLRKALDDDALAPTYIETVGGRGYRFLRPVVLPKKEAVAPLQPNPVRLAILPFRNLNKDTEDYFSDGLTEQMIAQVGCLCTDISVIAPLSVMLYKDTSHELLRVAQQLKSDYLLSGSVLREAGRFRITARLIRTRDQVCLWANSYTRNETDIFVVQDEITCHIAQAILHTLPTEAGPGKAAIAPAEYEKYLKGCYFAARGTEPDFRKAIGFFEQVIGDNPMFGPAYSSLAVLLAESAQYGTCPPKHVYDRVHALASRALMLSEQLPEAHVALGYESFFYRTDFQTAEKHLSRAVELNPSCPLGHLGYGMLMTALGHQEESIASMRQARELDPFSPMVNALLASVLAFAGRWQEALEQARYTLELEPNFPTGNACVGWVLSMMQQHEGAIDAYRAAVRCCRESRLMRLHLAHGLARADRCDEAMDILQQVIDSRPTSWASPYWIALVYATLGDSDSALKWLNIAVDECDGWRVLFGVDVRWQPLSSDACYQELVAQIMNNRPTGSMTSCTPDGPALTSLLPSGRQ